MPPPGSEAAFRISWTSSTLAAPCPCHHSSLPPQPSPHERHLCWIRHCLLSAQVSECGRSAPWGRHTESARLPHRPRPRRRRRRVTSASASETQPCRLLPPGASAVGDAVRVPSTLVSFRSFRPLCPAHLPLNRREVLHLSRRFRARPGERVAQEGCPAECHRGT